MSRCLPIDPLLPHLATALDADAVQRILGCHVRGRLSGCTVERVKYRPRHNLAVAYRLHGHDAAGQRFEQWVSARWCQGGDAGRRHAKALAAPGARHASPAGPSLSLDAAWDMVAHWWPNDAKLAAAALLADTVQLQQRWLPPVGQALLGDATPLRGHALSLVQVVPAHRVTARVALQFADGREGVVYAKADAQQRGPRVQAVMQALWDSPARRQGALVVPRPLLWQGDSGLHWQAALAGQPMPASATGLQPAQAARAGALLAALHQTPVPGGPTVEARSLLPHAARVADGLAQAHPACARRARQLAQSLMRCAPPLDTEPLATLHGDLHPGNLLWTDEGRPGLIDLDSVHHGPALLDQGAWVADALYRALLDDADPARSLPASRAFLDAHARASRWPVDEAVLAWAAAYQLLCLWAWRSLVNLKPGRFERIGRLLELALQVLQAGRLDAAAHSHDPLASTATP
jgi:hypothetical protein